MSGIIYESETNDGLGRFAVDLGDGRNMTVNVTNEGVILDVYRNKPIHNEGAVVPIPKGIYVTDHLGTVGMMFDEWADWVTNPQCQKG